MQRRMIGIAAGVVALGVGFYLFRPDRLFINASVNEGFPGATAQASAAKDAPKALFEGQFHKVAHGTEGTATIHQLADGKRVLRFTEFRTSNGPEVHVYLVAANDASDNATVKKAGFIDLGPIKGNVGNQNYEIPANLDLGKYRAVTIWCRRFGVNFGTAPLTAAIESASATGQPVELSEGKFHGVAHATDGTAAVYQLADGKRVLRFTDFRTSNGPEVHVYLVAANDASDNATVKKAGFIDLGAIKGNVGNQNYEVAADVDLSKYRAVTIWCRRFGVNFATAPLQSHSS